MTWPDGGGEGESGGGDGDNDGDGDDDGDGDGGGGVVVCVLPGAPHSGTSEGKVCPNSASRTLKRTRQKPPANHSELLIAVCSVEHWDCLLQVRTTKPLLRNGAPGILAAIL